MSVAPQWRSMIYDGIELYRPPLSLSMAALTINPLLTAWHVGSRLGSEIRIVLATAVTPVPLARHVAMLYRW